MALKTDRYEGVTDISFFMNEVAERGGVAVILTGGSGSAMDQGVALVTYSASPSGKRPQGLLMCDMVNIDQTRQHINYHKNETQKGGKVTLMKQGFAVTNMIEAGASPVAGNVAYLSNSGLLTSVSLGRAATPAVGEFVTAKDEDGYAKVEILLPQTY